MLKFKISKKFHAKHNNNKIFFVNKVLKWFGD